MVPTMSDDLDRLYAPLSTVERYHTEDKAWREAHMLLHAANGERMVRVEAAREATDKRLSDGAESFADLRTSIVDLRKKIEESAPKPMPRWQLLTFVLGPVVGIMVLVSSVIWQAARTPGRDEFTKLQEQVQAVELQDAAITAQLTEMQQLIIKRGAP